MDRTSKKSFLAGKRLSAKGSQSFFSFSTKFFTSFFSQSYQKPASIKVHAERAC
jgi:hypothetical protein